jgi:serine/threonine protein kinase
MLSAYSSFHRQEHLKVVGLNHLLQFTPINQTSRTATHSPLSQQTTTASEGAGEKPGGLSFPTEEMNYYSAPELTTGVHVGYPVDVYSVGGILYTLVTGHHPPLPSFNLELGKEWKQPEIQDLGIEVRYL